MAKRHLHWGIRKELGKIPVRSPERLEGRPPGSDLPIAPRQKRAQDAETGRFAPNSPLK
jgi:hypothetical protein